MKRRTLHFRCCKIGKEILWFKLTIIIITNTYTINKPRWKYRHYSYLNSVCLIWSTLANATKTICLSSVHMYMACTGIGCATFLNWRAFFSLFFSRMSYVRTYICSWETQLHYIHTHVRKQFTSLNLITQRSSFKLTKTPCGTSQHCMRKSCHNTQVWAAVDVMHKIKKQNYSKLHH